MAEILDVTDASFEREILKSETPAPIDFWAEWCAPCRQIAPIVKDLAASYAGKVKIVGERKGSLSATAARGDRKSPFHYIVGAAF